MMTEHKPDGERIAELEAHRESDTREHAETWRTIDAMRADLAAIRRDINRAAGGFQVFILLGGVAAFLLTAGKSLLLAFLADPPSLPSIHPPGTK